MYPFIHGTVTIFLSYFHILSYIFYEHDYWKRHPSDNLIMLQKDVDNSFVNQIYLVLY